MNRTAFLIDYESAVKLIEEEFGATWLTKKSNLRKTTHPIPPQWKETRQAIREYHDGGVLQVSDRVLSFTSFADDLKIAKNLENYKNAIFPRLKDGDFSKVQYEIYSSALCVRAGFITKFILPLQISRSADLLVSCESMTLHVECTQRDPYIPLSPNFEGPIKTFMDEIKGQNLAGLEVIFIILSALSKEVIPDILSRLQQVDRTTQGYLLHGLGYGIYVHPLPVPEGDGYWLSAFGKPPFTHRNGVFIPAGQNPAWSEAKVAEDESGHKFLTGHWRGYLHTIDSHNLATIVETFNRKRQQIPKEGPGILFIDLDVGHVHPRDVPLYLDIVAQGLTRRFSPSANTRVWAVVLTTKPLTIRKQGLHTYLNLRRAIKVVRNPHAPIPVNFRFPGEKLSADDADQT